MFAHHLHARTGFRRVLLGAAALVLVAGITSTARAADDDVTTLTVGAKGLDLATAAGQAAMRLRVERAARQVCDDGGVRTLRAADAFDACRATAVAAATPQLRMMIAQAGGNATMMADLRREPR